MDINKAKKWIEDREKSLAKSVIKWKLTKEGMPIPDENSLDAGAQKVVNEANSLVKGHGKETLKELKKGLKGFCKKQRN